MKKKTVLVSAAMATVCVAAAVFIFTPGTLEQRLDSKTGEKRDKPKEAGHVCFAAAKEKMKKADVLYEGSDVLTRNGKTYILRVRILDNQSSDNFHRAIFTCEIVDTGESWSVVRLAPAG